MLACVGCPGLCLSEEEALTQPGLSPVTASKRGSWHSWIPRLHLSKREALTQVCATGMAIDGVVKASHLLLPVSTACI